MSRGDLDAALEDLTQAVALREDVVILSNRAKVFERLGQWQQAADDYARALELDGGDRAAIAQRHDRCIAALREGKPYRMAAIS